MARRSVVISAELALVLMILLAVYPNGAVASGAPTSEPAALSLSGSVSAGSPTQFPWYYSYPCYYSWCYEYYWDSYWWNYPYYYYPTTSYEKAKTYELKVETNPTGTAPVNGKGTYSDGTVASFSVTSLIVPLNANQRYVFSYWSGDFSGATPSGTVSMNSPKTVVANYQLQNFLKVSVDPQGIASTIGEGWYLPTESVSVDPVPSSVSGGEGARYAFQQWTIDDAPVSGNSVQVTMDLPHVVVAHYKTQYMLTVSSDYGVAQGSGWYDAGSSATFSVTTSVDTSYGVRQVFERWIGDVESTSATATITMDSPHTITAIWRTDSTILYATIALGILAAFAVGIGLTMFAIARMRTKPAPVPPPKPVATVEPVTQKLKRTQTGKRAKPPPKPDQSEPPSSA